MVKKMVVPKKWIFLDLDDTIIPSTEIYKTCYKKLKIDTDEIFIKARKNVKLHLEHNPISAHNRFLYFKEYLTLKNDFSPKKLIALNHRYEKLLVLEIKKYLNKSHRIRFLNKLAKKFHLALVTNENCRLQVLKINEIDPHSKIFKFVVTSEEAGVAKPNWLIFEKALGLAQVKSRDLIFVGDDFKNDIVPTNAHGMCSIMTHEFCVNPYFTNQIKYPKNFQIISSLNELLTD